MKKITLKSGVELEINEDITNDMELLDALTEADEGNGMAISKICSLIMSKSEKKKLYDSMRNERGKVEVQTVVDAIMEIFGELGDTGKN